MKKRWLALALTLAMVLTMLPVTAMAADTGIFASGTGTADDPFCIADAGQLAAFRVSVNQGEKYAGQYIQLTDNITLEGAWTPIGDGVRAGSGYTGNAFQGHFDGNGKTISGLTISQTPVSADAAFGLFGVVDGGSVKNLTLTGVSITVTGGECVGGFVGLMVNGAVASKLTMGTENGGDTITAVRGLGGIVGRMTIRGTIEECVNYAAVSGSGANVGGIVGAAYYTAEGSEMFITDCENHGAITCTAGVTGGIAGLSAANVEHCVNTAAITGNGTDVAGIVAEQQNAGSVVGCVNSGDITNQSEAYGTGGIVGWVRYNGAVASYARKEIIEICNNVNISSVTGGNDGGGIVGTVYNAAVVTGNENSAPAISGKTFAAGVVGNLQFTETPVGGTIAEHAVTIRNNVSTTPMDRITATGGCTAQYVYDNGANENDEIGSNSTYWEARIGEQNYVTLDAAIEAAASSAEIQILTDITVSNVIDPQKTLTFTGVAKEDGSKPVIRAAGANGLFSQSGDAVYTLKNLELQVSTNGQWYLYHNANTLTVDGCDFTVPEGVTYTGNVIMGEGVPATDDDYKLIFTNNSITANSRSAITGIGNGSVITGNTIDLLGERWKGDETERTSIISVTAVAGGAGVNISENTFQNANRAIAVDNSTLAADQFTIQQNKFLNVRYAFELSPAKNADCGTYDLNKNYFAFDGTVSAPKIENADSSGDHFTAGDGSTEYLPEQDSQISNGEYYLRPEMNPSDLNTYHPSSGGSTTAKPAEETKLPFTDVSGHWAYGAIRYVYEKDLMNGVTTTRFAPETELTRGMLVTILYRLEKKPAVSGGTAFTDVDSSMYYADAIAWAAKNGIVTGYTETAYGPNDDVTREQLAAILWRYASYKGYDVTVGENTNILSYTDFAEIHEYAIPAMQWACGESLLDGVSAGTLNPRGTATRAQAATILMRFGENIAK